MSTKPKSPERGGKDKTGGYLQPALAQVNIGRNFDRGDRTHYTPWLVIRYANGDVGDRSLPGGTVFWESPDVWVESSLGTNQPVAGQPNTVFCNITNFGLEDATGVVVSFWWANPSLAITEANAHQINTQSPAVTVPAQSSVVVQCPDPWIPVMENGGHECLLAEAYIPVFDDITAPLDPVDDRHVGQKNEQVVTVAAGQAMKWDFEAVNIIGLAQALTFEIQPLRLRRLPALLTQRSLPRMGALTPPTAALPVTMKLHEEGAFVGPSVQFARRLLSTTLRELDGDARYCRAPVQVTHTAQFQPWELRRLEVGARIPAGARPGETYAFRVVQRMGDIVCGGCTVYAVVTH
jgi:hypothetical protein